MINNTEFSKRLKKILEYYQLTASSFAEKIKVQRSSISHLLSGRNKPSLDFVLKVLDAFDEVELYWLLHGKGNFPKKEKELIYTSTLFDDEANSKPLSTSKEINNPSFKENKLEINLFDSDIDRIVIFYKNGTFKKYIEV